MEAGTEAGLDYPSASCSVDIADRRELQSEVGARIVATDRQDGELVELHAGDPQPLALDDQELGRLAVEGQLRRRSIDGHRYWEGERFVVDPVPKKALEKL